MQAKNTPTSPSGYTAADKLELMKLLKIFDLFRLERGTMPVSQVCALLRVAIEEGESVSYYTRKANASQSVMSRHLLDLGDALRNNEPGMELLTRRLSPLSARETQYFLSPKGKRMLNVILNTARGS